MDDEIKRVEKDLYLWADQKQFEEQRDVIYRENLNTQKREAKESALILKYIPRYTETRLHAALRLVGKVAAVVAICFFTSYLTLLLSDSRRQQSLLGYDNMVSSEQMWITRSGPGDPESGRHKLSTLLPRGWRRAALIIGVTDYPQDSLISDLGTASGDARNVAATANKYMGIPSENILSLKDRTATEASVRAALIHLRQYDQPEDFILIYIACHAETDSDGTLRFLMFDSDCEAGLSAREILTILRSNGNHTQILLVADTCYSGSLMDQGFEDQKLWMVASSGSTDNAFEVQGHSHALFSGYWLEAVSGSADTDGDGLVMLSEAFYWTEKQVVATAQLQYPKISSPVAEEDLLLSIHPFLQKELSSGGLEQPAPALLNLALGSAGQRKRIWLNDESLGFTSAEKMLLYLAPGTHRLTVRSQEVWGSVGEAPEDWQGEVVVASKKTYTEYAMVKPVVYSQITNVIAPTGEGLFPQLVRSPATDAVTISWQDSTMICQFDTAVASAQELRAAFRVEDSIVKGVDVSRMLGLSDEETGILEFSIRTGKGDGELIVFVGGGDYDSLRPPIQKTIHLKGGYSWRRITIPLPGSKLHHLVNGFGLKVARRNPVLVKFEIRDVELKPSL